MPTSGVVLLHDNARPHTTLALEHCWSISTGSCLTTLLTALISLLALPPVYLPEEFFGSQRFNNNEESMEDVKNGWDHGRLFWHRHKNLFPDMTSDSSPAMITLRSGFKMYIFFCMHKNLIVCFVNSSPEVTFRIALVFKYYLDEHYVSKDWLDWLEVGTFSAQQI
jgi:hypothetical protein